MKIYHHLPSSWRGVPASLRGLYLRWWRFGPETEQLVQAALAREQWSVERWQDWQQERLAQALHQAATRVPYYRAQWAERRRRGDRASWECLENWPVLEKESVRQNARAFVADQLDVRRLFHDHTSGTTGKSLDLWASRQTMRQLYALFEARGRLRYGVSRRDCWAMVGGQLVTPVGRRHPPFWVWNWALKQLYMSSYHLAPDLIGYYLDALQRYGVQYLIGYTSSLYSLAQEVLRQGRTELRMRVVITNAEPVFAYQRETLAEAFQCPVRETYGMAEAVTAATECDYGTLHLWPELGRLEVFEGNEPVAAGQPGDLVATGLLNLEMPLVRYRIGDRGSLAPAADACACGSTLPKLATVEGRADDVLYTADGRRIGRLDPVFKSQLPIREAQIVQESFQRLRVRFVPTENWSAAHGDALIQRLRDRMGNIEVMLEPVPEVPRMPNGKFRAVICQIAQTATGSQ